MDVGRSYELEYTYSRNGHRVKNPAAKRNIFKKNIPFVNAIVDQSIKVFKTLRKASVGNFLIRFQNCYLQADRYNDIQNEVLNRFQTVLSSLDSRVSVEQFRMYFRGTQEDIMKILPFLKVNTLKYIEFWEIRAMADDLRYTETYFSLVAETDQWRHARSFSLRTYYFTLPLENWSHFSNIDFRVVDLGLNAVTTVFLVLYIKNNAPNTSFF